VSGSQGEVLAYRERILTGDPIKVTLWLAWPIILGNIVNISYNLIDAFWLGKLGAEAFSAPTVSWPLIMFFHSIGMGFSFAGVTFVSQYVGSGSAKMARKAAGMLVGFSFLLSLIIMATGLSLSPLVLEWIGVPPDVLPEAVAYITTIFAGEPVVYLGFVFQAIVNGLGDTKTPTWLGIVSSTVNLILDPVLIFGLGGFPELGVMGAALATILSRSIIGLSGLYLLARGFRGIKIGLSDLKIEWWWVKKIFKVGGPLAIQQSANSLGFVAMTSIVSRFGALVIAAYGFAIRIIDITQAFTWGVMRATSIMVGQNIGAEKYERTEDIVNKNMLFLLGSLAIATLLIIVFRAPLVSVFINDPAVIEEASRLILIFAPSIPFFGIFFIGNAVARGSGHTLPFTIISIFRLWVLRVGFSYILALLLGFGPNGVWIAMSLSNIVAGVVAYGWVRMGSWKRRVIEVPEEEVARPLQAPIRK